MGLRGYKLETGLARFLHSHITDLTLPKTDPVAWLTADRLTEQQVADLVQRYESGATSRQLAEHFSISKTSVVRLLRDRGTTVRRRGPSA